MRQGVLPLISDPSAGFIRAYFEVRSHGFNRQLIKSLSHTFLINQITKILFHPFKTFSAIIGPQSLRGQEANLRLRNDSFVAKSHDDEQKFGIY
jgi:hypothetical protein